MGGDIRTFHAWELLCGVDIKRSRIDGFAMTDTVSVGCMSKTADIHADEAHPTTSNKLSFRR
jgi:hypothetical protein